ncbi:ATPase [Mesorhizobium sp. WSM4312]|uniref:SRPBCC family protein n=1 Tax=unclassified Mesorhizobium TaxID=325217 RepID=UPI000BAF4611|nr:MULTISPECIES: SRPBCC family protein [unclassified Mesorhizobium]PBB66025.1 ATPase [Mesorhizobium sp. WSM4312]PBC18685.1 ATPase [Mesorhizobium sp. WSM4311]TRC73384.1 ATPase [Mesorhizobium sp. WSM4310]TRC78059.1 ATPase [Mesorhizobium sp. WSM4315]TRC79248.1 ATPase [Mesorhizobium sp. WSM4307]
MIKQPGPAPVRHSVVVEATIARAFKVFTEDFGSFKPREHNLLAVPIAETIFERRVGGHVYDRGVDGSECRWARVLAYDPPHRLVLSWDISPRWQIETNLNKTSEWEVRFTAETEKRTLVEIEHRNFERHGEGWEGVRGGVDSDQGWPLYLQRFQDLFTVERPDNAAG